MSLRRLSRACSACRSAICLTLTTARKTGPRLTSLSRANLMSISPSRGSIEVMQYEARTNRFRFGLIDFSTHPPSMSEPDSCLGCHGSPPRNRPLRALGGRTLRDNCTLPKRSCHRHTPNLPDSGCSAGHRYIALPTSKVGIPRSTLPTGLPKKIGRPPPSGKHRRTHSPARRHFGVDSAFRQTTRNSQ